jgi:hypothetical protein
LPCLPHNACMRWGVLLVVLVLAGCGSDEKERLTRSELVDRAGEICSDHIAAIGRLEKGLDPTDDEERENALADFGRVLPDIADEFRGLADDLRELEPPEDLEEQYDLTLDRIDRLADELDRAADEARAGDTRGFQAVLGESAAAESTQRFFRTHGFRECS